MRSKTIVVSAALIIMASASASWAQQATDSSTTPPPTSSETVVIPTVEVAYDSNIARSSREVAAQRGLSLADELETPSVDFTLARQLGRQILFLQGNASYLFHDHDTALDREDIDATGGVNAQVARCNELVTGTYKIQQSDLIDQSRTVTRDVIQAPSTSLNVSCGRAIGLAPSASFTESWRDNSEMLLKKNDSHTWGVTGGLAYRQPALGSLSLFGNYSETDFTNSLIPVGSTIEPYSYALYASGVNYTRRLGGRIEGSASISYTWLDPNAPNSRGFQGLTFDASGSYQLGSRILITASGVRATAPSNQLGALYAVNETYELDVQYTLGTRLTLTLTGRRITSNYSGSGSTSDLLVKKSTSDYVLASASYTLTRRIALKLSVSDDEHETNYVGASYSSTRVALAATATF